MTYTPRLVFYPASLEECLNDYQKIQASLCNIGLIQPQANNNNEFLLADDFLNLVTFLGCAPAINLSPEDGSNYCYVKFTPLYKQAQNLGYVQSFNPSCSTCKNKLNQWREKIQWREGQTEVTCPHCQHKKPLQDVRWRREAAYGRCGFYISNIHPHEALPNDKLLNTLETSSGFKWLYAYANNQETL